MLWLSKMVEVCDLRCCWSVGISLLNLKVQRVTWYPPNLWVGLIVGETPYGCQKSLFLDLDAIVVLDSV